MVKKSLFSVLITLLAIHQLYGQQLNFDEMEVKGVPPARRVCTLPPTDINAHFYVQASPELRARMKRKATTTFEVDYFSSCEGEEWPEEAANALEYALAIWGEHIESEIPIKVNANWMELNETTLGSARPTRIVKLGGVGEPDTWYTLAQLSAMTGQAIREQITDDEGNPIEYDIDMNIQCSYDDWYFGTDANTPEGLTDFVTVALHEIGHGIGFLGSMDGDKDEETAEWGVSSGVEPLIYDHFAVDGDHNNLIDETVYSNPSSDLYDALVGDRGGVYFDGFVANNTLLGQEADRATLYAPDPFRQGSSYSHVDLATFRQTVNALMVPFIDRAFAVHSPGPLFCGMLSDMEWPLGGGCLQFISFVSQSNVNFGVINVGGSEEFDLLISHSEIAESDLNGTLELDNENFAIVGSNQFSLEPGMATEITLQYTPQSNGIHETSLTISHNAQNIASPLIIELRGEALKAGQIVNLDQSYPNPFIKNNPYNMTSPVIGYSISEDSNVSVDLYTISGRHLQSLENRRRESGRYLVEPDMNGLSSGIYIYRVVADGVAKSGKLMYVK